MNEVIVQAKGLTAGYGLQPAIRDVSFSIRQGDYIGIVGPNGSGKTTLLRTLLGLLSPRKGSIDLFGMSLVDFRDWRRIGYLPQAAQLPFRRFPADVREVVASGRSAGLRFPKRLKTADRAAVDRVLHQVGLQDMARRMIGELSGGQFQRICLARALAAEPDLLVLDEPTSALDPAFREEFYTLLADLNREKQTTILLVTHDSATIGAHASRLLYMDERIIFDGSFNDFCLSPQMTDYFGPAAQHMLCGRHAPPHPCCPGNDPAACGQDGTTKGHAP
ncbi:MAG: metal ABC transporter ATP-binding protein [Verrucomicrobiota bacterium]|jgi:zinc transport system ATP-binding protein|nr:metal ABC transporter ATP-binding protein [Verrucomicrobiota bacterium]